MTRWMDEPVAGRGEGMGILGMLGCRGGCGMRGGVGGGDQVSE